MLLERASDSEPPPPAISHLPPSPPQSMPDECLARALLPWSLASSCLDHVVEIERSACAPFFNALVMLLGVFLLTHSDDQSWRLADSRKNATILFALCLLCGSAVSSAAISGILEATDATLSCTARSLPPLAVGVALGLRASQKPWTTWGSSHDGLRGRLLLFFLLQPRRHHVGRAIGDIAPDARRRPPQRWAKRTVATAAARVATQAPR